jgi:hypothetical protein
MGNTLKCQIHYGEHYHGITLLLQITITGGRYYRRTLLLEITLSLEYTVTVLDVLYHIIYIYQKR